MLLTGIFLLGFIAAIVVISLANGPSNADHVSDYNTALNTAHKTATVAAGSEAEAAALKTWKTALAELTFSTEDQKAMLKDTYADQVFFNDTLKTLRSGAAVEAHLLATADMLSSGSVKCVSEMRDDNGDYYVRWEMSYAGPKLNSGNPIVTVGMTQLRFNEQGRVIFHQDYWDSSTGVFEHIPMVGGLVKFVRGRM